MAKVAVILAQGFEEIEALTVVDVLRRANISCDMVGFEEQVTGSHDIQVKADRVFDGDLSDFLGVDWNDGFDSLFSDKKNLVHLIHFLLR